MHGDFSRWTFAASNGYRAVNLQQGRVLLDSEWNEQTQVTAHHDEVRTLDVVGRSGGPLPDDGGPGPFAVLAADGSVPVGVTWENLVVSPGRYYLDGVLTESEQPPADDDGKVPVGWPLHDQPHLRSIGAGVVEDIGLPEPAEPSEGSRYALYLEVFEHHVTADESPALREPALGGPDTTTRAPTVWQIRWAPLEDDEKCSDLHAAGWLTRTPRTMVAALRDAEADADPCRITSTGGYRRLENQLYRLQIHEPGDEDDHPTFLWSRENGSVVVGLVGMDTAAEPDVLKVDRVGRDEELSIRQGDLVEVTSTDRELRRLPGFLARAGVPDGLDLPVTWLGDAPGSVAALGRAPIVRRWEGGPLRAAAASVDLEDGIAVRFPQGDGSGRAETGDYWLVPARAVRLAYGLSELRGTIEWPVGAGGVPLAMRPAGPVRHVTPLAVISSQGGAWTLESDCRLLFPPLTGLVSLDLVGGDGQEDLPGEWLDEAVRVVVRNGGTPVPGAPVEFTAPDGGLVADAEGAAEPPAGAAGPLVVPTGTAGVAAVRWLLASGGPTTQTLQARRLDDHGTGIDVVAVATARLSVAAEVAWSGAGCAGFAGVTTVAGALERLVKRPELRLRGGDGQHLTPPNLVLPQPIRVVVDNACGPLAGVQVVARSSVHARVRAAMEGEEQPADLTGSTDLAVAVAGADGGAQFWWQPNVTSGSDVVELRLFGDDTGAPLVVTAQADVAGSGRRPGVHIDRLIFIGSRRVFQNDGFVSAATLAGGIYVHFDAGIEVTAVKSQQVARVELELPWPYAGDGNEWMPRGKTPIGTRTVTLGARLNVDNREVLWFPLDHVRDWLNKELWRVLEANGLGIDTVLLGRFVLEGWAIPGDPRRGGRGHVNTHADAVVFDGRTLLRLPTDDEVTGGTFVQWFHLRLQGDDDTDPRRVVPDVTGLTVTMARRALTEAGIEVLETRNEPLTGVARGRVGAVEPGPGTVLDDDVAVVLVVARGRG